MMNPEAKVKVLEALRSGKYTQVAGLLHPSEGCFCAWGVICNVSGVGKWEYYQGEFLMLGCVATPPISVQKWSGINWLDNEDHITIDGVTVSISDHNDQGKTFLQIADAIEEQL